jgi:hypothetical protein
MEEQHIRLIMEPIEAVFIHRPALEKRPGCPDGFIWRGELHKVTQKLAEWHDYRRKGRMEKNMRPAHAVAAAVKGSWGVGQDYYQVETEGGRIFTIYYDRAPRGSDARKGEWYLEREQLQGA